MQVHHYDPVTLVYTGTSEADTDPMQPGQFLCPAHATFARPPEHPANMRLVYSAQLAGWRSEVIPTPSPVALQTTAPATVPADPADLVRGARDRLLSACDWVVTRATELGEPVPVDWAAYRQALRDVTTQEGFPLTVVWPVAPNADV